MQTSLETDRQDNLIYYSFQKLFSHNAFLNFVYGGRGIGKSYGMKDFVAKRFINHQDQFVYIRRFASEVEDALIAGKESIFWNQITSNNDFYKNHKMSNTKDVFTIDNKVCGYAIPLSTSLTKKSATFENVKTVVFDEFTIVDSSFYSYLKNEVFLFLELMESITRMRNDVRFVLLGNNISSSNPYMDYFHLSLPYNGSYKSFKDGLILVNCVRDNTEFIEAKKKSRVGRLIDSTEYGDYNLSNQSLLDSDEFIKKKDKYYRFLFTIKTNNEIYGVWNNWLKETFIISNDYDKNSKPIYAIEINNHTEDTQLLRKNDVAISCLTESYRMARLFFENQKAKNNVLNVLESYI